MFKVFIANEPKVVLFGIMYMLIFMMMIHERKDMWNMKYGHCAMNEESYVWPRDPMK